MQMATPLACPGAPRASPVPLLLSPSNWHAERGVLEPARSQRLQSNRHCFKKKDGLFFLHKIPLLVAEGSSSPERRGCITQEFINTSVLSLAPAPAPRPAPSQRAGRELSPWREVLLAAGRIPLSSGEAAALPVPTPSPACSHSTAARRGRLRGRERATCPWAGSAASPRK